MFSISDIKQEAYPAAYRRGKELYERGLVQEFSYDVYTEDGVPKAELIGRVKGTVEDHYDVRLVIDEEYAEVSESRCNCEAFCNYEGICKHPVSFEIIERIVLGDQLHQIDLHGSSLPCISCLNHCIVLAAC